MGGGQPFPLLGDVGGLLGGLRFLDGADKLGPVILGILRDGPEHIGYQGQDSLGPDAVLCAAERPAWDFAVLAASKLWVTLAIIDTMNIHLAAAIGTVHQAGQRVGLAPAVRVTPDICPDTLHIVKGFLVDNGLMGVLKNRPLAFVNIVAFLVLEVLAGLEIDGVAQVFPLFQNVHNGGRSPAVGVFDRLRPVYSFVKARQMDSGDFNLCLGQQLGDLIGAVALHRQGKDTAYHFGGFFVHKPVFPFFVPQVAVNDSTGQMLAAHAFGLEHRANFPAGVAGIKLVHDVAERGKIIIAFQTVHTVIDGDQTDTALPQNLHDLTDFQIIAPQAAHVLYDDGLHPSGLDFLHHRQKTGAVKTGSRYAVIGEVGGVWQPIPAGKVLQHLFLIGDGIALAL